MSGSDIAPLRPTITFHTPVPPARQETPSQQAETEIADLMDEILDYYSPSREERPVVAKQPIERAESEYLTDADMTRGVRYTNIQDLYDSPDARRLRDEDESPVPVREPAPPAVYTQDFAAEIESVEI
jgi:hypothetical protein